MSALPFIDLAAQRRRLGDRIDAAIDRVLAHGRYVMGPEIDALEVELAAVAGARHAVACSNGTDALALALMAKGIRPGDAVLVPAFTFAASAAVVAWMGATPVMVDVLESSFNMDPASLEAGIATARRHGLVARALMTVDLFGQPADYDALLPIAERHGLWVLDDAAQAFGAKHRDRGLGSFCLMTATSFFPAKPLGCYGEGGAVLTDDDELDRLLRSLRNHGAGAHKYDIARIGMNARMDTLQAAILIEKLAIFEEELADRQVIADRYADRLADVVAVPRLIPGVTSTWAQYTVRLPPGRRDAVAAKLDAAGIPTAIHYPRPLHRQEAFARYPVAGNGLPVAERLAETVLSLPMHAYLDPATQDRIIVALREAIAA